MKVGPALEQVLDQGLRTPASPGHSSLLQIMQGCLMQAKVLIELRGQGIGQPGFAQVAVYPGSLAGLLIGLHG